jgi:hypothetical protein
MNLLSGVFRVSREAPVTSGWPPGTSKEDAMLTPLERAQLGYVRALLEKSRSTLTTLEQERMLRWIANKVRDIARGYSDADIESMQHKLASGNKKFTDREHTAYVCEVQHGDDREVL